ncbi:MAG: Holliday junction branch migration protein RuvA [Gammaproteobacteria bacterium]
MIGFLRGQLISKAPPFLLLDVQGVGYEVEAPMTTFYNLPAVGEEVRLHTHLAVREDAHILYGFFSEGERSLFRTLIKVNGVGPKLALTLLSGLSVEDFYHCVSDSDVHSLVRLPGVGKKTAERLIVEMRDRLPQLKEDRASGFSFDGFTDPAPADPQQEAVSALIALGYKPLDASRMVRGVSAKDQSCEEIIRRALQGAGKS